MYRIEYSERAIIDLNDIYNYIYYELVNPIAAISFRKQIPKPISNLQIFPYLGKRYNQTNFRYIYFKNYLIIYSINNHNVEIQRIFHKKQNFKNVL